MGYQPKFANQSNSAKRDNRSFRLDPGQMSHQQLLPPTVPSQFATISQHELGSVGNHDSSVNLGLMRASKESFNGLVFQSMRESALPRPSVNEELPTPPLMTEEREESTILPEPVNAESNPNMPVLNPKTNFRYSADGSSLNGIAEMGSVATDVINPVQAMTIEETLAAINNSTIMNQFTSSEANFAQLAAPNPLGAAETNEPA